MTSTRLAVTGLGPVSAAGIGREAFAAGVTGDRSHLKPLDQFALPDLPCSLGAEVTGLNLADHLASEKTYLDRCSEFALASAALALRDAQLKIDDSNAAEVGLCLGSTYGCLETMRTFFDRLLTRGAKFANSLMFSHSYVNTPISLVAIEFGIRGHHSTYTTGLTSGATALAAAFDALQSGHAQAILAGGVDALSPTLLEALAATGQLRSDDTDGGFLPGEGSGMVVLETEAHASARGAAIRGWLAGAGLSTDVERDGTGVGRCWEAALAEAALQPADVQVVYLHANGHPASDAAERHALPLLPNATPVAPKERWGEPLAAGAPLALIASLCQLPPDGAALISAVDPGGGCVALVVRGAGQEGGEA